MSNLLMTPTNVRKNRRWQEQAALVKRRTRHKIIYDGTIQTDVEVVMMAMAGMTTKAIAEATGLSPTQVQYRISKAQKGEGVGQGYRSQWRSGNSPWLRQFQRMVAPSMEARIKAELPKKFILPAVAASTRS